MGLLERVRAYIKNKSPEELRKEFEALTKEDCKDEMSVESFFKVNGFTFNDAEIAEPLHYELNIKDLSNAGLFAF